MRARVRVVCYNSIRILLGFTSVVINDSCCSRVIKLERVLASEALFPFRIHHKGSCSTDVVQVFTFLLLGCKGKDDMLVAILLHLLGNGGKGQRHARAARTYVSMFSRWAGSQAEKEFTCVSANFRARAQERGCRNDRIQVERRLQ